MLLGRSFPYPKPIGRLETLWCNDGEPASPVLLPLSMSPAASPCGVLSDEGGFEIAWRPVLLVGERLKYRTQYKQRCILLDFGLWACFREFWDEWDWNLNYGRNNLIWSPKITTCLVCIAYRSKPWVGLVTKFKFDGSPQHFSPSKRMPAFDQTRDKSRGPFLCKNVRGKFSHSLR